MTAHLTFCYLKTNMRKIDDIKRSFTVNHEILILMDHRPSDALLIFPGAQAYASTFSEPYKIFKYIS